MHKAGSIGSLGIGEYVSDPDTVSIAKEKTVKVRGDLVVFGDDNSEITLGDTGWIDLGTSDKVSVEGAINAGRNGKGCFYRVINGNHVYVAFNAAFTYTGEGIVVNEYAIPSQYLPKRKAYAMCILAGRAFARVGVSTAGTVIIDWVQDASASATTTSAETTWIDGYIDYWI